MKRFYSQSLLISFSLLFFTACLLNSTRAHGQKVTGTGDIRGKVIDEKGESLISATIVILDKDGKSSGHGTISDFDGNFLLESLKPGSYDLKFSYLGYSSQVMKSVQVDSGKMTGVNMKMYPAQSYQEVVVTFTEPIIDPYTTRIISSSTNEDIRNAGAISAENIAATQAGVQQTDAGRGLTINNGRTDEVLYIVGGGSRMNATYIPSVPAAMDMEPMPQSPVSRENTKPDLTSTAEYKKINENEFKGTVGSPLSTFSIDVDAASYSIMRRMVLAGEIPPADALRAEEMINYFPYEYEAPKGKEPFAIHTELADCPWNSAHQLIKIGIQGKKVEEKDMPPANLVFLVDVSGSMMSPERLPLVQYALSILVDHMRPQDRISLVAYAGNAGLVLPSTSGKEKTKIKDAINSLVAGGSTAGGAGIALAYKVAKENFIKDGNNRIILCTDGDFNVGLSSDEGLVKLIEEERKSGVFLSAIGVGTDNYKDSKMEQLADKGNGNYAYLDGYGEAQKIMVKQMGGTILTIAKDVKIQAVFNPAIVRSYRLIGYEDRKLENKDFKNDKVDAGEIGAGASVTALYELVLGDSRDSSTIPLGDDERMHLSASDLMAVRVRYKAPDGDVSRLMVHPVGVQSKALAQASEDFRFASAVAAYTMLLRGSQYKGNFTYDKVLSLAQSSLGNDENGYRNEFLSLVKSAAKLRPEVAIK